MAWPPARALLAQPPFATFNSRLAQDVLGRDAQSPDNPLNNNKRLVKKVNGLKNRDRIGVLLFVALIFGMTVKAEAGAIYGYNFNTGILTNTGIAGSAVGYASNDGTTVWANGNTLYNIAYGWLTNPITMSVTGAITDIAVYNRNFAYFVADGAIYGYNFSTGTLVDPGTAGSAVGYAANDGTTVWADGNTLYNNAYGWLTNPIAMSVIGAITDIAVYNRNFAYFVADGAIYGYNFSTGNLVNPGTAGSAVGYAANDGTTVWADGNTLYNNAYGWLTNPITMNITGSITDIAVYNRDFAYFVVTEDSTIPVPASAWLFGLSFLGLVGFHRRHKT